MDKPCYIRPFDTLGLTDLPLVGGKNASLGELTRELVPLGIRVPEGFAITVEAYRAFLGEGELLADLRGILEGADPAKPEGLQRRGALIRNVLLSRPLPPDLEAAIVAAYQVLGEDGEVAVRSSATAEDLPDASFAGQQESFLNVRGVPALLEACRKCFASLYTDRAIAYRAQRGMSQTSVALSIGVQRMVRSDLGTSGVAFTLDPETGFRDVVILNASYGLGESIVQGLVTPDEYCIFKPTLASGDYPILRKSVGSKETKRIYGEEEGVRQIEVSEVDRNRLCLSDADVMTLAGWACKVEAHYSRKSGRPTPMDLEWAKDGRTGELFLVQARPETVQSQRSNLVLRTVRLLGTGPVLAVGRSVGSGVAVGPARVVERLEEMSAFQQGEVLVTDKTDPDWEPYLKRAVGVVTNRGSRTCHAAIVSRELGLPAVVGALGATTAIRTGQMVTVSCAGGERGLVYEGALPYETRDTPLETLERPRTQVKLILADPDEAFRLSFLPNDGVGLVRMEFIVSTFIRVHPMALVHPERLTPQVAAKVMALTEGYDRPEDYFVDQLSQGLALLAAAFYPKPVLLRFSDFKTNEYAHLMGGTAFEPPEENPMLGFRGASRYYHPAYREGFALECRAVKRVRENMGLGNMQVMVPFCRTPAEGIKVLEEMAKHGLVRGEHGLEVHVMCEIPSNVLNANAFLDVFDGFSIGSNDLTQLTLGIDRDSELVAPLFDERDPAVKELMARAILAARARGRAVGICGQAPSDFPEIAEFLVQEGIQSIALNPDAVLRTLPVIVKAEAHVFFPHAMDFSTHLD